MKNPNIPSLKLLLLVLVLFTTGVSQAQSWITNVDTVSTTGYAKAKTFQSSYMKTDSIKLSQINPSDSMIYFGDPQMAIKINTPPNMYCTCPIPIYALNRKGFAFGGGGTLNFCNTSFGIGTLSPDAGLSIYSCQYTRQFSILGSGSGGGDVFTIDNAGNTYAAGSVSIQTTATPTAPLNVYTTSPSHTGLTSVFLSANAQNNGNAAIFFTENMGAGDYNDLTQLNDNGIFWADNYGVQNNSSGLVIAPWNHSTTGVGIRLDASGKVDMEGVSNGSTALIVGTGNVGIGTHTPNSQCNILIPASATLNAFSVTAGLVDLFDINPNGNVLVQTTYNTYALNVGGTIWCNEIKVCLGGCDFVFDKGYKLMPLNELENYLELNHHLPGIASAKEMETIDGVALGKLNSQLLQKVEELTLYTIQLKKQLDEMQAEIAKIKGSK